MEKPAVIKRRVYALTVDLGIIVLTNAFLVGSFNEFTRTVFFHLPFKMQLMLMHKSAYMASISMMSLTFAYFTLFYFCTNGRTLGKTIFHLRAVNADRSEISLKQSMMRALAYFTCAIFGSFLFALSYIRKDEKSLADIFSGMSIVEDTNWKTEATGTEFQAELDNVIAMTNAKDEKIENSEQDKAA